MRRPMVAGNWKMNGSKTESTALIEGVVAGVGQVSNADVLVCPPFILLSQTIEQLAGTSILVGAQDLNVNQSGAYTGEISGPMLKDAGCSHVIVGHSERRAYYGETSEVVAEKFKAAQQHGLIPVLCVGETLEQRQAEQTEQVIVAQIDAVIELCGIGALNDAIIAYEPVWAIGTGMTATPEQAQLVHAFIRAKINSSDASIAESLRILYGGSMKPDNAADLIEQVDIDGGLIGGASLNADDFIGICRAS